MVDLPVKKVISPKEIIDKGCKYFGFTKEKLLAKCRKREVVYARHMIINILCKNTIYKLSYIGELMGDLDHTTVIHARDKAKDFIRLDINYRTEYEALTRFIFTDEKSLDNVVGKV